MICSFVVILHRDVLEASQSLLKKMAKSPRNHKIKRRSPQKCRKCRNHGKQVHLKGHKKFCEHKSCQCNSCKVVNEERRKTAERIAESRKGKCLICSNQMVCCTTIYTFLSNVKLIQYLIFPIIHAQYAMFVWWKIKNHFFQLNKFCFLMFNFSKVMLASKLFFHTSLR